MSKDNNAPASQELNDSDMDQVAGGLSIGTFQTRGSGDSKLSKISDDVGTLSEFVAKITT